ncbi:hypothetical protein G5I_09213 [Acromyrmex echinatior]|uniref:Uncharacterized protein n=1 Tax=Acromyrmex echinatior TaxID=103372 RepID=F4WTK8_ACREC|nr:hypothetical protein G5I_09213 [Acromyrmex echinatior]
MQLSALVRGVSRSTRAVPAGRVGGEASVPGRVILHIQECAVSKNTYRSASLDNNKLAANFMSFRWQDMPVATVVLQEQNDSHLLFRAKGRRDSRVERRFTPNLPEQRSSRRSGNALGVLIKTSIKNGHTAPVRRSAVSKGPSSNATAPTSELNAYGSRKPAMSKGHSTALKIAVTSLESHPSWCDPSNKTLRNSDGDIAETVSERGAIPDQNESLVPSRHNGMATWTLRKFSATEFAKRTEEKDNRISHPIAVQSIPNLVFMVQNSPESDNNNKRRSPSTSPYVRVPRSDMATSIRLRATHCRGDT